MADAKCELVREWLERARLDLATARRLGSGKDPLWETAVYHCQQAAEKAVKGYLVFRDRRVKKTHDVEDLVKTAEEYEARFSAWHAAAKLVTPYAQEFRYPVEGRELLELDEEQYRQAEQAAAGILAFVCSLLPQEARPCDVIQHLADCDGTLKLDTIYVYLPNEGVDVWRPVLAERVSESIFRIAAQEYDRSIEQWEFGPGEVVYCEPTRLSEGMCLVAKRRA
jgi:HEPN domain-containing protein